VLRTKIESSNLDADFTPGEATTNAIAELDKINAPHEGYLDSFGIDRLARAPVRRQAGPGTQPWLR
jgi:hypothetical protein